MIENLVTYNANHLERCVRVERIDEHVAVDTDEMFRVHDRIFILVMLSAVVLRLKALAGTPTWPAVSMISVANS